MASSASSPSATATVADDGPVSAGTNTAVPSMFSEYDGARRPHRSLRATPDPALASGMPLPVDLRKAFPKHLIGKPIDELDPFYASKATFVVVGHHWIIHRFDGDKSLFLMSPASRVRSASIVAVTHAAFHYFMFIVILTNVFCYLKYVDFHVIFFFIYFVEFVVKVIAYGLLAKRFAYLRDPWNWVDFVAILLGFVTPHLGFSTNPIRFLRLANFFTRPRLILATSCSLLLRMRDVLCFAAFSVFFYSVFFMHFYTGALSQRCVSDVDIAPSFSLNETNSSSSTLFALEESHRNAICGNATGAIHCPANETCLVVPHSNPDYGYTNFDTFFSSAMSVIRLLTRDSWERLLTQVESATGGWSVPSFLVVLVFGSFVLSNLIMAHMAIAIGQLMDVLRGTEHSRPKKTEDAADMDEVAESCEARFDKTDFARKEEEPELVITVDRNSGESAGESVATVDPVDLCCEHLCSCKCCSGLQTRLSAVVDSRPFNCFICVTIITNMAFLALDHYDMSMVLAQAIDYVNFIALVVFIVEAVLKVLAMSPNGYFRDSWCLFEFFIVLVALAELMVLHVAGFGVLRGFRIFRVVRLAKFNVHLNRLLRPSHANVYLLVVFVLAFGLLGYGIFGYRYWIHRDFFSDRLHFMDFWSSIPIVFQVLCGHWSESYRDCLLVSEWTCSPFFFAIVVMGNLLVISVFISMVTTSFVSNDLCNTELDDHDDAHISFSVGRILHRLCGNSNKSRVEKVPAAKSEEQLFEVSLEGDSTVGERRGRAGSDAEEASHDANDEKPLHVDPCCPAMFFCGGDRTTDRASTLPSSPSTVRNVWRTVRRSALTVLNHKIFHDCALIFIFTTSIAQVWDDGRLYSSSGKYTSVAVVSRVVSIVVCVVFILELVLKFAGIGLHKYFSDGWNRFDFAVTVLHVAGYLWSGFDTQDRSLAILEALRVLKLFSYQQRLRVVVDAVLFRFGHVFGALLATLLVWLMFATIGVQLFAGRYRECVDDRREPLPVDIVRDYETCLRNNFTWIEPDVNFDHVPNALFVLLQVATMRSDLSILLHSMDDQGVDRQPFRNESPFSVFYFMLFMLFGVLCCLACIVRAFVTKVNSQRRLSGGYLETLLTAKQRIGYEDLKRAFFKQPLKTVPEPQMVLLLPLYRMVTSRSFHVTVFLVLVFNAAAMAFHYPFIGSRMYNALGYVQIVFNGFFFVEIALKTIAFRSHFFTNPWNIYDFVVIVPLPFSVLAYELAEHHSFVSPLLLRLLIVLRLVRRIRCVRRVFHGIRVSIGAYENVAFVLAVVVFFYTRLGIGWFGSRDHPSDGHHSRYTVFGGIDDLHNFDSFGPAVSTVSQMAIGGGLWDGIHRGILHSMADYSIRATLFVLSLLFISFLVVVHFFVVLLLEHYERIWCKRRLRITDGDLEDFAAAWRVFDPSGSGTMSYENFAGFLSALPPTYRIEAPITDDKIASLDVKVTVQEQRLTFDDVLVALLRFVDPDRAVFRDGTVVVSVS